jgi:hypothetical protein
VVQSVDTAGASVGVDVGLGVRFGNRFLVFSRPTPEWFAGMLDQICELGNLQENWDSYGGRPIDPQCAQVAVKLLLSIMDEDTPRPAVVPTNRGGIQLEWHCNGIDLEVAVQSPSRIQVAFEDQRGGAEWERQVENGDLRPLVSALQEIAKRK